MTAATAFRFRWRYSDAIDNDQWTEWHTSTLPCEVCCHGGPVNGERQSPAEYTDDHGGYTTGHTYFSPTEPEDWVTWESEVLP